MIFAHISKKIMVTQIKSCPKIRICSLEISCMQTNDWVQTRVALEHIAHAKKPN